jgi:hypothetical protein
MKNLLNSLLLFSVTFLFAQNTKIEIINTSVNSSYAELGITYFNSKTVIFASSKKVETDKNFSKSRRKTNRQLYLELYFGTILENGDIIQTGKFNKQVNSVYFESDISFTPDKKTIYFTWNNFYNTQKRRDSAKWKTLRIVKAQINENFELSNIQDLPFNSNKYSVKNPEVSKDGKQLFFVSDMPDSFGETDIYVVDILDNNSYSKPKNLGKNVNTKETEMFPFVDENKTLYFTSNGHKGLGNFDIFKSKFGDNIYQKSENLQAPINSEYDDFGYVINTKNNTGFFTSNRKGSLGDVDIYAFTPIQKQCKPTLFVTVFNEKTKIKENDISIIIYENNQLLTSQIFKEKSNHSFNLKCNTSYKITISKEGFYETEIEFKTSELSEEFQKKIYLKPIECKQLISGIIFNEINLNELKQVEISLFENNKLIKNPITTTNATFNFDLKCNTSYKIIAKKIGFHETEIEFKTSELSEEFQKKIYLKAFVFKILI